MVIASVRDGQFFTKEDHRFPPEETEFAHTSELLHQLTYMELSVSGKCSNLKIVTVS